MPICTVGVCKLLNACLELFKHASLSTLVRAATAGVCVCVFWLCVALPLRHSLATAQPACIIHTGASLQIRLPRGSVFGALRCPLRMHYRDTL